MCATDWPVAVGEPSPKSQVKVVSAGSVPVTFALRLIVWPMLPV